MTRLLTFAFISQIFASLLFTGKIFGNYVNVLFTLSAGLISIRCIDKFKYKYLAALPIFVLLAISELLSFDYGAWGILIIAAFYVFYDRKMLQCLSVIIFFFFSIIQKSFGMENTLFNLRFLLFQFLFNLLSILLIQFYNGKLGKNTKKIKLFFYFFYPVHICILCLVKMFFV